MQRPTSLRRQMVFPYRRMVILLYILTLAFVIGTLFPPPVMTYAAPLPEGFQVSVALSGLKNPTDFRFASDGRVFVTEKTGLIKVFDNLGDTTPTTFADLRTNVYHGPNDHGLLGLALAPTFPADPSVYVLYTYDAPIGGNAPRWNDVCPDPPGIKVNGCVVSGRLSRLQASGSSMTGKEQVLIEDWCQQYTSHSIGALEFGADGALYVSAGEGANTSSADYGQLGSSDPAYTSITPLNPCGDPPAGVGTRLAAPTAEGGALRSQDLRTPNDPASLDGTIIRVNPKTGEALSDNPGASRADANARRIIAYGLRNPFDFTFRPGTSELWIGDVGWGGWEEINHMGKPTERILNFGWPCYEGDKRQSAYDGSNVNICEQLYAEPGAVTAPFHAYSHRESMIPGDGCSSTTACGSAITALAFYENGNYPDMYKGALFFGDYARDAIFVMLKGADGKPDPATRQLFLSGASDVIRLRIGPNGDLFYADFMGGKIYRIQYFKGNQPPTAVARATPQSGASPLTVRFDASGSSDPDAGDTLSYAWDLDGDGQYDDSTAIKPSYTYSRAGTYVVRLKVTDRSGAFTTDTVTITVGNSPPTAVIDQPPITAWKVGDTIYFSGHATDTDQGKLPASSLEWTVLLHHCYSPTNCHSHTLGDYSGVMSGSFVAPDHEDLTYLEIRLTATDQGGLQDTTSIKLDPQTVTLSFLANTEEVEIVFDSGSVRTPFSPMVVAGSSHVVIAPAIHAHRSFKSWSDGDTNRIRTITTGTTSQTYTAIYVNKPPTAVLTLGPPASQSRTVAFSSQGSSDPEGDSLDYRWDFGDGTTSTEASPVHTYKSTGVYRVSLTVTDDLGASHTVTTSVSVRAQGGLYPFRIWIPIVR